MGPTIAQIKSLISKRYRVPLRTMDDRQRDPRVVRPRHVAIYLSRRLTGHSFPMIGKRFGGRDHSTICSAYWKIQDRIHRNRRTENFIGSLIDELTNG